MNLGERELSFLSSLREFSKVRRYKGVMPDWLTCCCVECDVDSLIEGGYVEHGQGEHNDWGWFSTRLNGMRITDKGREFLRGVVS